ncbi:sugar transferase [Myxococcota bacterium]|nr:sugar transferase [Myxococcota bacterium]
MQAVNEDIRFAFQNPIPAYAADLMCFAAATAFTWYLLAPPTTGVLYTGWSMAFGFVVCPLVLAAEGPMARVFGDRVGIDVVFAVVCGALGAALFSMLAPPGISAATASHAMGVFLALALGSRLFVHHPRPLSRRLEPILVIGRSELGRSIAESVEKQRNREFEIVGFLSAEDTDLEGNEHGIPVLGKIHDVEKWVEELGIKRVVVAPRGREDHFPAQELLWTKLRGCRVESGLDFYERLTGRIYLKNLRSSYLIFSHGFGSRRPLSVVSKRILDLLVSTVGLFAVSPVMILTALAIRLDSKGPIIFEQQRIGQDGKAFRVRKFRSMFDNAEAATGPCFTQEQDSRITRVGYFIRKTRIDELPQLWNVFRGEMSLVGPRPERPEFIEELNDRYPYFSLRSSLKPGITGWAQIRHGYVSDFAGFEEKLSFDLYYMKHRSLWVDLSILWKTAKTVVQLQGV